MTQRPWIVGSYLLAGTSFVVAILIAHEPAKAIPAYADQTEQSCASCHVGGFGPELTPFGREFKLGGYTLRTRPSVPLSAMAIASWTHTRKDQVPPPERFSRNDNILLDGFSGFIAGGLGDHFGGFVEIAHEGAENHTMLEMVDLRAVTSAHIFGEDSTVGLSLNNAPMVQDAWNTTPMWAFPYTNTTISETPAAAPLIDMLMGNVVGLTGYAWVGGKAYVEVGGYTSPSTGYLSFVGAEDMVGSIHGIAPYGRVAWQTNLAGGTFELGANAFNARIFPMRDRSAGLTDHYTDFGIDSSWQKTLGESDTLSLNFRYEHEKGDLRASCVLGLVGAGMEMGAMPTIGMGDDIGCARYHLDALRGTVGYSWHNKIGVDLSAFSTTGSRNDKLWGESGSPDSNGLTGQIDYTFWGDGKSPLGTRANARVGVQYTIYGKFNGRRHNFDAMGGNAADNNTLRVFTWLAY